MEQDTDRVMWVGPYGWGRPPWEGQFQEGRDCKSCTGRGLGTCKGPEVRESVLPERCGGQRAQGGMSEGTVGEG